MNMIGVPSGWERLAGWLWADPPTYTEAVRRIHFDLDNPSDPFETCEADEWYPDYREVAP